MKRIRGVYIAFIIVSLCLIVGGEKAGAAENITDLLRSSIEHTRLLENEQVRTRALCAALGGRWVRSSNDLTDQERAILARPVVPQWGGCVLPVNMNNVCKGCQYDCSICSTGTIVPPGTPTCTRTIYYRDMYKVYKGGYKSRKTTKMIVGYQEMVDNKCMVYVLQHPVPGGHFMGRPPESEFQKARSSFRSYGGWMGEDNNYNGNSHLVRVCHVSNHSCCGVWCKFGPGCPGWWSP